MELKTILDILNRKLGELRTLKNNCSNVYQEREINRAFKEIKDLKREFKSNQE